MNPGLAHATDLGSLVQTQFMYFPRYLLGYHPININLNCTELTWLQDANSYDERTENGG